MAFSDYKKKKLQEQKQANEKSWVAEPTGKTLRESALADHMAKLQTTLPEQDKSFWDEEMNKRSGINNKLLSKLSADDHSFNKSNEYSTSIGKYLMDSIGASANVETSDTDVKDNKTPTTDVSSTEEPSTEASSTVKSALTLLQELQNKQYADPYGKQLEELINNWNNREKFSYDLNTDPLYQAAKAEAETSGDLAMRDTIGKMSTMTGGYGNSYAQTAGQQMYNKYLEELNANIPSYYETAYNKYYNDAMLDAQKIDNLKTLRDEDYSLWQDQYNRDLNYISSLYGIEQDQQELLASLLGTSDYLVEDIGVDTKDTEAALKALATGGANGLSSYMQKLYGSLEGDGKDSYIQELLEVMKNSDLYARVALQDAKNWNFDTNPEGNNVVTDIKGGNTYTEEGLKNVLIDELRSKYGISGAEAQKLAEGGLYNLKKVLGRA